MDRDLALYHSSFAFRLYQGAELNHVEFVEFVSRHSTNMAISLSHSFLSESPGPSNVPERSVASHQAFEALSKMFIYHWAPL